MNERYPTHEGNIFSTQFGNSMMKCSGGLCRIRSNVIHLVIVSKKMPVEAICNVGAISINNRPEKINKNIIPTLNYSTYHIVATTPRNPANRSVAPRCIASSGRSSLPIAVSHAQRTASDAFGVDSCIMQDILSRPSSRMRELSRGFFLFCSPWHAKWAIETAERRDVTSFTVAGNPGTSNLTRHSWGTWPAIFCNSWFA